jgi:hypothetical protein
VSGDLVEFENGGQKCIVIQTGHLLETTRLSQKFALKFKNESEQNLKQRNLSFATKKAMCYTYHLCRVNSK